MRETEDWKNPNSKVMQFCKAVGVELTNYYRDKTKSYAEYKIDGYCQCGRKIENISYNAIKNALKTKDKKFHCKCCEGEIARKRYQLSYEAVCKEIEEKGCKLLDDNYVNCQTRMNLLMSCGHEYKTSLLSFRNGHGVCKKCSVLANSGENTYNWKGGYDEERERIRKTYENKQFVKGVLKRDGYCCAICKSKHNLQVHHLDGFNWCTDKRFDINNGVSLYEEHHILFHKQYGCGNNTKEEYYEFISNIKN